MCPLSVNAFQRFHIEELATSDRSKSRDILLICALALSLLFMQSGRSASSAESTISMESILGVPHVAQILAYPGGGALWTEVRNGRWTIHTARPPELKPVQWDSVSAGDGVTIELADVSSNGDEILVFRGALPNSAGETPNPQSLNEPTSRELLLVSSKSQVAARIAGGPGSRIRNARISPSGLRGVYSEGGNVWEFNVDRPSETKRLFVARGTVTELLWSPDGKRIAFVADRSRYNRGKYAFVGAFDLASQALTYVAPGVGFDQSPVWSPEGDRLALIRFGYEPRTWRFENYRTGSPFSIVVADARSGEGREVWTAPAGTGSRFNGFGANNDTGLGGRNNLMWMADGRLVFPYEKTGWRLLYSISSVGGAVELLTPGRFEIDGAASSPDRTAIVYWSNSEADPHRLHLSQVSLKSNLQPTQISSGTGIEFGAVFSLDSQDLLYLQAGPTLPTRLVMAHGGTHVQLSTGPKPNATIAHELIAPTIVELKAEDGINSSGVLYRHEKSAPKSRPAIIYAHGGSRLKEYPVAETARMADYLMRYFATRGYVILKANYRGGRGYGLDFREPESFGARGAGDIKDVFAAAEYLRSQVPEVDPRRIAIVGVSYGGHLVTNALARSDLFSAGVTIAGVGDWVVEMEKDSGESLQFNIPQRIELESLAYSSSAISQIDRWGNEPLLFIQGDDDVEAPMQQTLELYMALRKRNVAVDALIIPGESHSFFLASSRVKIIKKMEEFLDRHIPSRR
jgi:dipeptidyl aminopeptidase/acylaminoacyl peptidase